MINSKLINAVRELVEAVVNLNCLVNENNEALLNEYRTVARTFDVLREIRADPELSSLHEWAEKLLKHADGFDPDEQRVFNWLPRKRRDVPANGLPREG